MVANAYYHASSRALLADCAVRPARTDMQHVHALAILRSILQQHEECSVARTQGVSKTAVKAYHHAATRALLAACAVLLKWTGMQQAYALAILCSVLQDVWNVFGCKNTRCHTNGNEGLLRRSHPRCAG